jgi:hypothetical protein
VKRQCAVHAASQGANCGLFAVEQGHLRCWWRVSIWVLGQAARTAHFASLLVVQACTQPRLHQASLSPSASHPVACTSPPVNKKRLSETCPDHLAPSASIGADACAQELIAEAGSERVNVAANLHAKLPTQLSKASNIGHGVVSSCLLLEDEGQEVHTCTQAGHVLCIQLLLEAAE